MSNKLNLDIFGESKSPPSASQPTPPKDVRTQLNSGSPKFVPVGFYPEHLRLLDEAVLNLRQQGHWKASKSGIIRKLIEGHREDLATYGKP